jgi:hypothetical protein
VAATRMKAARSVDTICGLKCRGDCRYRTR